MGISGDQLRISYKNPVRVATTANLANIGAGAPNVVDGITLLAGDRVLVFNQTASSENGIYTVNSVGTGANGAWSRSKDWDSASQDHINAGIKIYVQEGATKGGESFRLKTSGVIVVGSSAISIERVLTTKKWNINNISILNAGEKLVFGRLFSPGSEVHRAFKLDVIASDGSGFSTTKSYTYSSPVINTFTSWLRLVPSFSSNPSDIFYSFEVEIISGTTSDEIHIRINNVASSGSAVTYNIVISSSAPSEESFSPLSILLTAADTVTLYSGSTTTSTPSGLYENSRIIFPNLLSSNVTGLSNAYLSYAASTFQIKSPTSITSYIGDSEILKQELFGGESLISISSATQGTLKFSGNGKISSILDVSVDSFRFLIGSNGSPHTIYSTSGIDTIVDFNPGGNYIMNSARPIIVRSSLSTKLEGPLSGFTSINSDGSITISPSVGTNAGITQNVDMSPFKSIIFGGTGFVDDAANSGLRMSGGVVTIQSTNLVSTITLNTGNLGDITVTPLNGRSFSVNSDILISSFSKIHWGSSGQINDYGGAGVQILSDKIFLQPTAGAGEISLNRLGLGDLVLSSSFASKIKLLTDTTLSPGKNLNFGTSGIINDNGGLGLNLTGGKIQIGTFYIQADKIVNDAGGFHTFGSTLMTIRSPSDINIGGNLDGIINLHGTNLITPTFSVYNALASINVNRSLPPGYTISASGDIGLYPATTGGYNSIIFDSALGLNKSFIEGSSDNPDSLLSNPYFGNPAVSIITQPSVATMSGCTYVVANTLLILKANGRSNLTTTGTSVFGPDILIESSEGVWSAFSGSNKQLLIGINSLEAVNTVTKSAAEASRSIIVDNDIKSIAGSVILPIDNGVFIGSKFGMYHTGNVFSLFTYNGVDNIAITASAQLDLKGTTSAILDGASLASITSAGNVSVTSGVDTTINSSGLGSFTSSGNMNLRSVSNTLSLLSQLDMTINSNIGAVNISSGSTIGVTTGSGDLTLSPVANVTVTTSDINMSTGQYVKWGGLTSKSIRELGGDIIISGSSVLMGSNSRPAVPSNSIPVAYIRGYGATTSVPLHVYSYSTLASNRYAAFFDFAAYPASGRTNIYASWRVLGLEVGSVYSPLTASPNSTVFYGNFTGAHTSQSEFASGIDSIGFYLTDSLGVKTYPKLGMIMSSTGTLMIGPDDRLPHVEISSVKNDPTVMGVFYANSVTSSDVKGFSELKDTISYAALGEGDILVSDIDGPVVNGSLIASSAIPGFGSLQVDDLFHSYTVAKCTETIDWSLVSNTIVHNGVTYKYALVGCTYHCG